MPRKIEISHRTIIFTFFLMGAIWFIWEIRDIVLILFVSLLIMVILHPIARRLSKFRIPKALSVLIVYFIFFGSVIVSLVGIIPPLVEQTTNFVSGFPTYIANLHIPSAISNQVSGQILSRVGDLPESILGFGFGVVANIVTILTVLTFAFYLLMARDKLDKQLSYLVGDKKSHEIGEFIDELEVKLGGWARGQILLMVSVGVLNYLGLLILGIPYALPIAILAGFLELVPYVGPILGAIPALFIGFGISPALGLGTALLAFLVQQLENYILVPKIMERSVGVTPIITLLSLAIGFKVAGIAGVLISVPVVITLQVLVKRKFLV
jgi:predicted PurR-regulated permease PerM